MTQFYKLFNGGPGSGPHEGLKTYDANGSSDNAENESFKANLYGDEDKSYHKKAFIAHDEARIEHLKSAGNPGLNGLQIAKHHAKAAYHDKMSDYHKKLSS